MPALTPTLALALHCSSLNPRAIHSKIIGSFRSFPRPTGSVASRNLPPFEPRQCLGRLRQSVVTTAPLPVPKAAAALAESAEGSCPASGRELLQSWVPSVPVRKYGARDDVGFV